MESTLTDQKTPFTREQIRTFHVSGRGLEAAVPAGPLRPAVLDQLEQLPAFETSDLRSVYGSALTEARAAARKRFLAKIKHARGSLADLISLDDRLRPANGSGEAVPAGLGTEGSVFFNPAALADVLRSSRRGLRRMETAHRRRIENTLTVLDSAMHEIEQQPACFSFDGPDRFQVALDFCNKQLSRFTLLLRAMRLARLESESAYDPAIHEEALERLDWQSAAADELLALAPVVIFETAEALAQTSLTSLGRILRSGRPMHVLVASSGLYADDLTGSVPDFGYIAIAHREAFVLQSSVSRPEHLAAGLSCLARTLRPAVAIVSVPTQDDREGRLATSLLNLSRAFPLYSYNPDCGLTWTERFELLIDEEVPVTAADFAAVSPAFRPHFRVLPASAWSDEQIELSDYLKRYTVDPPLAIPFIFVASENGVPQRAVVTRELVNLCRDRLRAWAIFEELSGVKPAAVAADTPAAGLQADEKLEGARLAIERVVGMLVQQASQSVDAPGQAAAQPEPQRAFQVSPDADPAADAAPALAEMEDPFIDSFLCTSCNDCFKVNPRVFQYDGNKQAFIADAGAGTFAELVKAAEGCPAKCIHPGTPRAGDSTVTPQLLAKAAKLR